MLLSSMRFAVCALAAFTIKFMTSVFCDAQFFKFRSDYETTTPLPFPTCKADNIDCLRRGLRTFFFLMDSEHFGMKAIDPILINSIGVTFPEQQLSILMRRVNVTGARWTKLAERKFNLEGSKNGVIFNSDLHLVGDITMNIATRVEPYVSLITMDLHNVESNITYSWSGQRGVDNEDYILIGTERIAVRNTRTPTFFLQPSNGDAYMIEQVLKLKPSILDHLSNEIVTALMHSTVDNFRLFANKTPVRQYYKYY